MVVVLTSRNVKEEHEEMQADLRHIQLKPRAHGLGADGAQWAGKRVGGDPYRRGEGVDLEVHFFHNSSESANP